MYEGTPHATSADSIDLAQKADFDLGILRVRPARCEVECERVVQTVQRRVMQVLVALAEARGSVVSHGDLVMRCWRGLSVSDDAIVRCISKLRKLSADYPVPPYSIETIPGVGYRLTSLSFAEGDPATELEVPRRRLFGPRALAAMGALAISGLVGAIISIGHSRDAGKAQSIRVMVEPFETLSDSGQVSSLARRIPNEVVNELGDSQIEAGLKQDQTAKESKTTGPPSALILTGIVRGEDPDMTVVNVRLEDGPTHTALWAMEFKRDSRKTADLPLEIAARVADEANIIIFARGATPPLTDNSALSALLQVTDMIRDPPDGAWAQMIARGQDLVSRYPQFAFGHDVLAVAYAEAAQSIDVPDRAKAMSDAARREANLTLKLDPEDAGAYAILSDLQPSHDYRAREEILLRGLKFGKHPKEPLGGLYSAQGRLLDDVGRLRESLSLKLVAHAADEWGAPKTAQLARAYANMGNLTEAKGWLDKGVQLWPNHSGILRVRQYVAGFYQRPPDALAVLDSLDKQTSPNESNAIWRTYVEARAAHSERTTNAAIHRIHEAADKGTVPREIEIMMIAGLGKTGQAVEAANSGLDHQSLEPWFLFTPITRNLRQDPGFVPLAARLGLIKYWRETGRLPDFCTDPAPRSDCSAQLLAAIKPS